MKKYLEVEKARKTYHKDPTLNSVHRSSLLIPEVDGAEAEISFLNHFLIKRKYPKVACRITSVDSEGQRIEARLHEITEPRLYTFNLTRLTPRKAATHLVEFFAAENLFIPFPAVMVNHRGKNFINFVHSFNRVLNDVFENDSINSVCVKEASIDVRFGDGIDTFCLFVAGQEACKGVIKFELSVGGETIGCELAVNVSRFGSTYISVGKLFADQLPKCDGGVLKISQPLQPLFYGRLFCGIKWADGAFSGNHSYYDCSEFPEYWVNTEPSSRLYPFFKETEAKIRMYPILSPGRVELAVRFFGHDGSELSREVLGQMTSPSGSFLNANLSELVSKLGLDASRISAFCLSAHPTVENTPTRVSHQLVYGQGKLEASIALSLMSPNAFMPPNQAGRSWGQAVIGGGFRSYLSLTSNFAEQAAHQTQIVFYDGRGELARRNIRIEPNTSWTIDVAKELEAELSRRGDFAGFEYVWFYAESNVPDLAGYSLSYHEESRHFTGEHSF